MQYISQYFIDLSKEQEEKFKLLMPLYKDWNDKINIISRKDIDNLYLHHVLHSLSIAKFVSFKEKTHIADIGTGGGFPGIPLAILFPEVKFTLVDSIGKKIKVVDSIIHELQLNNCLTINDRAENIQSKYDFVISRAVTRIPTFISWTKKLVRNKSFNDIKNGIIYLKGGDLSNELDINQEHKVYDLNQYFTEPFFSSKKLIHILC